MRKEVNAFVGKMMQSTRTAEEAKKFSNEVELVRKGQVRSTTAISRIDVKAIIKIAN